MSVNAETPHEPLRYVVLHHGDIREPHYDLMFETAPGSPLATWRAPEWPLRTGTPLTHLSEHRREYLDYEGPVGGGRGRVRRVAAGNHRVIQDHPVLLIVDLEEDRTVLRLFRSDHWAQVLRA